MPDDESAGTFPKERCDHIHVTHSYDIIRWTRSGIYILSKTMKKTKTKEKENQL